MDAYGLAVYNQIHKLGFTPEDLNAVLEETKQKHNGLAIMAKTKKAVAIVDHDKQRKILIKKPSEINLPVPSRVLFKTVVGLMDCPEELYTIHSMVRYYRYDTIPKTASAVKTLEGVKSKLAERFLKEKWVELGSTIDDQYCSYKVQDKRKKQKQELIIKQLKAIYWLFDEEYTKEGITIPEKKNRKIITKVFQKKNYRLALFVNNENKEVKAGSFFQPKYWKKLKGIRFYILALKAGDGKYQLLDEGREVNSKSHGTEVWVANDLLGKLSSEELDSIAETRNEGSDWLLLDAKTYYEGLSQRIKAKMQIAKREAEKNKAISKAIDETDKKVRSGHYEKNGITYDDDTLTIGSFTLKSPKLKEHVRSSWRRIFDNEVTIRGVYKEFVNEVLDVGPKGMYGEEVISRATNKTFIEVNNIKIDIDATKLARINNKRVSRENLAEIIENAVDYETQAEFDEYVTKCSKIPLTLQKVLGVGGLSFDVHVRKTDNNTFSKDEYIVFTLSMMRENDKNYLKIGKEKLRIKDWNSLLTAAKKTEKYDSRYEDGLERAIHFIKLGVPEITPEQVMTLIKEGRTKAKELKRIAEEIKKKQEKENLKKLERSKIFLAKAIELTNAEKITEGFLVKGASNVLYFIRSSDANVWTTKEVCGKIKPDNHLCIVDDHYGKGEYLINDKVANRLLMLHKDLKTASDVYTVKNELFERAINCEVN